MRLIYPTLVFGLALAACGGGSSEVTSTSITATTAETSLATVATPDNDGDDDAVATSDAPTDSSATSQPPNRPIIEHALGSMEAVADPQRVVALDRSLIDAALALELPLVGYTTYSDPDGALPAYFGSALDEFAADATWVGDLLSPNLEAIAALRPDLILTSAVRHEDIYEQLARIAPTLATESAGGGWKENIELVAAATGRDDLAENLLAEYAQRAADVGTQINVAAGDPTISVVRFVDAIRLYQPTSFSGVVLEDAGLARPESQQDREEFIRVISEEEMALADADVLLYTVYDNDAVVEMVDAIQGRPLWGTLSAVQEQRAYPIDDDRWMSGVGLYGAHMILDDLLEIFGLSEPTTSAESDVTDDSATSAGASLGSIAETAIAHGSTFVPGYAGLTTDFAAAITGAGPVTALMPSDDGFLAFAGEYPNLTEELRSDLDKLDEILLYHVLDGRWASTNFAEVTEVMTLQGEPVTVEVVAGVVSFNGGEGSISLADLEVSNGVLQILDGILLPPSISASAD